MHTSTATSSTWKLYYHDMVMTLDSRRPRPCATHQGEEGTNIRRGFDGRHASKTGFGWPSGRFLNPHDVVKGILGSASTCRCRCHRPSDTSLSTTVPLPPPNQVCHLGSRSVPA